MRNLVLDCAISVRCLCDSCAISVRFLCEFFVNSLRFRCDFFAICLRFLLCGCDFLLCYALLCFSLLCFAMLCYALRCFALLCYAMLCLAHCKTNCFSSFFLDVMKSKSLCHEIDFHDMPLNPPRPVISWRVDALPLPSPRTGYT